MARLKAKLDELKKDLIVLKHTRKITKDDLKLPEWYELNEDYKEVTSAVDKAVVSIKNSIMFQRREYFCLVRESTREMINTDRNWKSKSGLSNDNWPAILKVLTSNEVGLVRVVKEGSFKAPTVYQVIDKDILKVLKIDSEQQRREALEFAERFQAQDRKSDNKPDTVGSRKNVVDSCNSGTEQKASSVSTPDADNELDENLDNEQQAASPVASDSGLIINPRVNIEHQQLLETCLAVPAAKLSGFEKEFLSDKADRLIRYGSFSPNMVPVLKKIAAKSIQASAATIPNSAEPLPTLTPKKAAEIIEGADSADDITRNFNRFNIQDAAKADEGPEGYKNLSGKLILFARRIEIAEAVIKALNLPVSRKQAELIERKKQRQQKLSIKTA